MSERQAEGAVMIVGNKPFDRKWKLHTENEESLDLNTLPHQKNIRQVGKAIEAMTLAEIVREIMGSNEKTVVTYNDDGSKKQGTGSFSVQGVTINGKFRAFPTLQIASEARKNIADLKLAVLTMLEAASNVSSKEIYEKLDFVMTDQTSHNLHVDECLPEKLSTEHTPDHLFCNVHPSLMFNRVITTTWNDVENAIGRDKIYSSFLVNATSHTSTVTEQSLECISRLISHEFDHKSWNKAKEFDIYIAPKKNKSVRMRDERFNRLTLLCAITLYHLEDVDGYLTKFEHVTNQLACIVRCFLDIDFLKALNCTGALIGLHLVEPFLSLTTSTNTTYSKLIAAFQQLYRDLFETEAENLLVLNKPAFSFVSKARFYQTQNDEEICEAIQQTINEMKPQVIKLLKVILPRLADGFKNQKGDIFGFANQYAKESQYTLSKMDQAKLEKTPSYTQFISRKKCGFPELRTETPGHDTVGICIICSSQSKICRSHRKPATWNIQTLL